MYVELIGNLKYVGFFAHLCLKIEMHYNYATGLEHYFVLRFHWQTTMSARVLRPVHMHVLIRRAATSARAPKA